MTGYTFSHRVFNAYLNHRERRTANNRTQPSFSTMARRIANPDDVPSHISPIFDGSNQSWAGRNVFQIKHNEHEGFYLGMTNH